jgi:hypothetical protein
MTPGAPIVTPLFVDHVASGKPRIVIDGLVDGDPAAVKVRVVDQHGGLLADITHLWQSATITADAGDPVHFDLSGYLTSDTHLPQNAARVHVDADRTFEVDLHECPHVWTAGESTCRWCGEPAEVEDVPVYCGTATTVVHGGKLIPIECGQLDGHDGPHAGPGDPGLFEWGTDA